MKYVRVWIVWTTTSECFTKCSKAIWFISLQETECSNTVSQLGFLYKIQVRRFHKEFMSSLLNLPKILIDYLLWIMIRSNHISALVTRGQLDITGPFVSGTNRRPVDHSHNGSIIDLLPDTQNCALRMRRECRERFPRHRLQRKPLVSDPYMDHGTFVTHLPWCMLGSLTRCGGENVPGIPTHAQPPILRFW